MVKQKNILVIGDLILDSFRHGAHIGTSIEDDRTPVALQHKAEYVWGGAGFLVRNMLALGARVTFVSALGDDLHAELANQFSHPRLTKRFLKRHGKPTTLKERFWIGAGTVLGWHQYDNTPLHGLLRQKIMRTIRSELPRVDAVVIADYRHGLLSQEMARSIVRACARARKPLYVDSQIAYGNTSNLAWYRGANLFCLNEKEARAFDPKFSTKRLHSSIERLKRSLSTKNIVVKMGPQGSVSLLSDQFIETKAPRVRAIDTTGAGDAFLACLALGSNPPSETDLTKANTWAALSTTMIGTSIALQSAFRDLMRKQRNG